MRIFNSRTTLAAVATAIVLSLFGCGVPGTSGDGGNATSPASQESTSPAATMHNKRCLPIYVKDQVAENPLCITDEDIQSAFGLTYSYQQGHEHETGPVPAYYYPSSDADGPRIAIRLAAGKNNAKSAWSESKEMWSSMDKLPGYEKYAYQNIGYQILACTCVLSPAPKTPLYIDITVWWEEAGYTDSTPLSDELLAYQQGLTRVFELIVERANSNQ